MRILVVSNLFCSLFNSYPTATLLLSCCYFTAVLLLFYHYSTATLMRILVTFYIRIEILEATTRLLNHQVISVKIVQNYVCMSVCLQCVHVGNLPALYIRLISATPSSSKAS